MGAFRSIVDSVHQELDAKATPYDVGAQHLETNKSPTYVVWVATRAQHTAEILHCGPQALPSTTDLAKPFMTRRLHVDLYCWAADYDAVETLLEGLLAALYTVVSSASLHLDEERWPKQQEYEHLKRGEMVVVRFQLDVPVIGWRQPSTIIETASMPTKDIVDTL